MSEKNPPKTYSVVHNATAVGRAYSSRTVGTRHSATAQGTASWSAAWDRRREFWLVNWGWLIVAVAITIASAFLGLLFVGGPGVIVSLIIGAVEFWVGPKAVTIVRDTVREIRQRGDDG